MRNNLMRLARMPLILAGIICFLCIFAHAYSYPTMPDNWSSITVTIGDVTLPLAEYPDGAYWSPEKSTMTVSEQATYGIYAGRDIELRGWQCVGFGRYVYTACFYNYPQNATIDAHLGYSSGASYAYNDMLSSALGVSSLPAGYSVSTLKTLLTSCQPGALMRIGGHTMMIMAIFNDGVIIYDANFSSGNEVDVRMYTWQSFVECLGSRGIEAVHMPKYYPGYSYNYNGAVPVLTPSEEIEIDVSVGGTYYVANCTSLNIRKGPGTTYGSVGTVRPGTALTVIGMYGNWAKISYNGGSYWVSADYLREASQTTVVFDAAGGYVETESETYLQGGTFGSLPYAEKAGSTFMGWYYDGDLYTDSSVVPSESYITMTAHWSMGGLDDVSDVDWFAPFVQNAISYGIISANGSFNPYDNATRGQFVTVLGRTYTWQTGVPLEYYNPYFTDVSEYSYCAPYVTWGYEMGVVQGISETEFGPDNVITREQIATFLYRYVLASQILPSAYSGAYHIWNFYDGWTVNEWAVTPMNWAIDIGLFKGDDNGYLNPTAVATRAEMITIISRFIDYLGTLYV